MRIAFALTSALSLAALAQPAPETAPPAPPPPPAEAPAPKPEAPPVTAQPATQPEPAAPATPTPAPKPEAPPATAQPATQPAPAPKAEMAPATAQPATQPAPTPKPEVVPATAQPAQVPAVVPAKGSAGLTLPVGPPPPDEIRERARAFFHALLQADAREMVELSASPFYLESQRFDQPESLLKEWVGRLRAKRTDLLTLYGIDVYTPAEMEQKYGKPPARLKDLPLRGSAFIAVANLSGHAAILIFRDVDGTWSAVAYTD